MEPGSEPNVESGRGRRHLSILLAILLLAAMVRFWSIDFGLPHTRSRPDETKVVRIVKSPWDSFHPGTFAYPSLFKYCVLGLDGLYYAGGLATGRFEDSADLMAAYALEPGYFYLMARLLAAAMGTATVLALYLLAREVVPRSTATLAAFFLALCFLHVRDSHFGVTDVPMTFFIVLSMLFVARSSKDGRLRNYLLAGLFCGLAGSTKYAGAFMAVSMGLAHISTLGRESIPLLRGLIDRRLLAFCGVAALTFLAGTPYALLDSEKFMTDVGRDAKHLAEGHGMVLGRGWWYHLKVSLPAAMGWPLFAASLLGLPLFLRRYGMRAAALLGFPIAYYVVSGSGYAVFLRYSMPVIPFLCLTAAVLLEFGGRRSTNALATALALLLIAPSADKVVRANRLLGQRDNRLIAAEWVQANLPPGSTIHQAGSRSARLELPASFEDLERELAPFTARWGRGWIAESLPGLARGDVDAFVEWDYDADSDRFELRRSPRKRSPDYIFLLESALPRYERLAPGLATRLSNDYELIQSFEAIDLSVEANRFDPIDAFYLPYAGFEGIERPGPNVHVYRRSTPRGPKR